MEDINVVKPILKEAREAIKNKNYETSLKLCKQILREQKDNYMALVFLGVSYQETGQPQKALTAFQGAVEVNSNNTLAWNGLVNLYDKVDTKEAKAKLIPAYISLLQLETVEKKLFSYTQKLSNLSDYGNLSEISLAVYSLIKSGKYADVTELALVLMDLLSKNKNLPLELIPIYEDVFKIISSNKQTVSGKYYGDYLNFLYKQGKTEEVLKSAKKMYELFESDWLSLRWICKIFNESYVESGSMIETRENITSYYEELMTLETQSATALFTKSIMLIEDNKLVDAKNLLDQAVNLVPGLVHAWILLLKCYTKLHLFSDAVHAINKVDKLLQSNDSKRILKKCVDLLTIEALSWSDEEDDLRKVLELNKTIHDTEKVECLPHVIRAKISLGNYAEAKVLLYDLKNNCEDQVTYKLLNAQLLHKQGKYAEALNLLESNDVLLSEWWMEVGTLYWDDGQYKKSLLPFLKATKLDSDNYKCFLLLGHYYRKITDLDKARRCYEKAFKINTQCVEAGIELSKIYRKLRNWEANLILLQSFTNGLINKKNSWAWLQLGLHYLEQQEYDKAINNLRFVIRIDETNMLCWESLADAYLAKGAYSSALKCYEKASDLSEVGLYPLLQMANIKQILGEYVEAKSDFEEILLFDKYYVPALKGLAETCLLQAKDYFRNQRLGTARDHIQLAADKLISAIQGRSDLACLWKLLGDCCLHVTKLPEKYCFLILLSSFVEGVENIEGNKIMEKKDLFTLAMRCYCKGLGFVEDNVFIWHDLSVCYLSYALSTDDRELHEKLSSKAQAIAEYCTSKNPTCWKHWNLLANVAINLNPPNYRLSQHALIKAVIADNNSAVSWSNLGTLYFILDDLKLANEAFSQAQKSDPNYVNSWIGQALIAETLTHEDAMDLFRHSTQLGFHKQGAIGYAHWVCHTLKRSPLDAVMYSIHNMHAIPVACDSLSWYTEHNPNDGSAWNMMGILKERMGLKNGAADSFRNALSLSNKVHRDLARSNYGRLLATLDKYPQAIDMFNQIEVATFNSGSGLALALFKSQNYKESYEAYESTLHWLSDEPQFQSDLLVALASMAYMFEGVEAAKTLLFQSIQLERPSPWGFYATLSLGLLHKDLNLAGLVLKEILVLKDRKDCLQHYAVLSAYFHLLAGDCNRAVYAITKILHKYPDQAAVWLALASILIRLHDKRSSTAATKCSQVAMKLGQTTMDVTKVLCLVSLSSLIMKDNHTALLTAQKAVHCYPDVVETWAAFVAALTATKRLSSTRIKHILKQIELLNSSDVLNLWMRNTIALL